MSSSQDDYEREGYPSNYKRPQERERERERKIKESSDSKRINIQCFRSFERGNYSSECSWKRNMTINEEDIKSIEDSMSSISEDKSSEFEEEIHPCKGDLVN